MTMDNTKLTEQQKETQKILRRMRYLANQLFNESEYGKEFVAMMEREVINDATFPINKEFLEGFGGAHGFLYYREGWRACVKGLKRMANDYVTVLAQEQAEEAA